MVLIEKAALMKAVERLPFSCGCAVVEREALDELIGGFPEIEAEPVVRCGECAHRVKSADLADTVLCKWLHDLTMPKDGFCCYGERKEA